MGADFVLHIIYILGNLTCGEGGKDMGEKIPLWDRLTKLLEKTKNRRPPTVDLLIVEDNESDVETYLEILRLEPYAITVVPSAKAGLDFMEERREPVLIFTDVHMDGHNGIEFIKRVKLLPVFTYIICASAYPKNHLAAIDAGANSFLPKPFDSSMMLAYLKAGGTAVWDYKRTAIDELTGLPGAAYFWDALMLELDEAQREKIPISLLFVDGDGLKRINDAHGHLAGSRFIAHIGHRLKESLRSKEAVAFRYAGDELIVILTGADENHAAVTAARIEQEIGGHPVEYKGEILSQTTATVGHATAQWHEISDDLNAAAKLLFERADAAMYVEKGKRKARGMPVRR